MTTIDDLIPVKDLLSRYGLKSRVSLYTRLDKLGIQTIKSGRFSYITSDQLKDLDRLNIHLENGGTFETFDQPISEPPLTVRQTQVPSTDLSVDVQQVFTETLLNTMAPYIKPDPLVRYEALQRAAINGWLLDTSDLAPLLKLKSLPSHDFERYGFKFQCVGRNGAELAWRVTNL